MIRERRAEDLEVLCAALAEVDGADEVLGGRDPVAWLTAPGAFVSWVFDQAPIAVAPTRNVLGHVQIYPGPDDLRIGRLFVRPGRFDENIARFLLREASRWVEARGAEPVLDRHDVVLVPARVLAASGARVA